MAYDYSNQSDFTQKDLMIHLLQSAQHSATREEVQDIKIELKNDISELRIDIRNIDSKFQVLNNKFNKAGWLMFAFTITILFKEKIMAILF